MKHEVIDIRSKKLNDIVLQTNAMLNGAFWDMVDKKVEEATVTVKISVGIAESAKEVDGRIRLAQKPVISCDIKKTVNYSEKACVVVDTGDVELEEENGKFVLVPAVGSQVTMDELPDGQEPDEDAAYLESLAEEYPIEQEPDEPEEEPERVAPCGFADPIFFQQGTGES